MKKLGNISKRLSTIVTILLLSVVLQSCGQAVQESKEAEYYSLRPEIEKAFGYSHAVKVGDTVKISGAVSMDENANPTAVGDMAGQMENIYSDLEKILSHYNCSFDDVIVENIYTTDMALFLENSAYRREIYTNHFPTGSWIGVKEFAIPTFLLEIEMEAYNCDSAV